MSTNSIQISEFYNEYFSTAFAIRDVFINHFGDENVDINIPDLSIFELFMSTSNKTVEEVNRIYGNLDLLVRFPEVTITNEQGNSVNAKNIYAKVPLTIRCNSNVSSAYTIMTNAFQLSRSHFTKSHFISDYMHSHCNGVPFINSNGPFLNCCLGSGPIRSTISTLCSEYDISMWQLFCFELESYVQTESIAGGPWRRMSNISSKPTIYKKIDNDYATVFANPFRDSLDSLFNDFILYYIKNTNTPFSYDNGCYMIAMPYLDFALQVSNKFIDWLNKSDNPHRTEDNLDCLCRDKHLNYYIIRDNKIHTINLYRNITSADVRYARGRVLFSFKNTPVKMEIEDDIDSVSTETLLLSNIALGYIATLITKTVNYFYGNKQYEATNTDVATNCRYRLL